MPRSYDQMSREELGALLESLLHVLHIGESRALPAPDDITGLVRELQMHQIELELQNRTLRETQQVLEESRDRYAALYDFAPVGYLTLNRANRIVEINLTGAAMLGVERAHLIGQPLTMYVTKQHLPIILQNLKRCRSTTNVIINEIDLKRPDDALLRVQLSSTVQSGYPGDPASCTLTMTNISARVQAEQALKESEARYRTISEIISDSVFAVHVMPDHQPVLEWLVGTCPAIPHDKVPDLFLPEPALNLVAIEDQPQVKHMLAVLQRGEQHILEIRMVGADGEQCWIRLHVRPEQAAHGSGGQFIVGAIKDITEYKQASESIRFQAHLLDTVGQAVIATDQAGTITYWNRAAAQAYGWTAANIIGQPIEQVLAPAAQPALLEIQHCVHGGEPWLGELEMQRLDGTTLPCLVTGTPINTGDSISGAVFVTNDLTERKDFERKLLEVQKLESLGVLASGIAHDFNNLIGIISGNAALIEEDLPADSPLGKGIAHIQIAARRGADLTKQLLAYAGKGSMIMEPIDVNDLVYANMRLLEASISPFAAIHYNLAPYLPPVVADEVQLRQVLMNLVINASEAIGEQAGIITITTTARYVSEAELSLYRFGKELSAAVYIVWRVSDTGLGIDPATLQCIFDPFFTTKFTGRGLGLAAVLGIIQGHQGALQVESTLGQGTTFTILLPVADSSSHPRAVSPHVAIEGLP